MDALDTLCLLQSRAPQRRIYLKITSWRLVIRPKDKGYTKHNLLFKESLIGCLCKWVHHYMLRLVHHLAERGITTASLAFQS